MKIYMGRYPRYFGPYDLAELLKYVGVSEERRDRLGEWLDQSWFGSLVRKLNDLNKRKIKVQIDPYDTWSMDYTLALIIVPMLKQLRETQFTAGSVADSDVPKHLRSTSAPPTNDDQTLDSLFEARWNWVLDEMIWSFEQIISQDEFPFYEMFYDPIKDHFDKKGFDKHNKRIENGLILFGKYYRALWD